ncbi:MAG: discoidin domain-containing protein [Isosphaeraceae bacterium]
MSRTSWPAMALLIASTPTLADDPLPEPHRRLLESQTFWDNRDWAWYEAHIPFFECPDPDISTTYYYRWELLTKHLTYGSTRSGYSFTEFIDRPFWSGAYGAISCPAGHQLYEARWLKDPRIARDYARCWFRTPGAQPRNYSTWLADAAWAVHQVHPDPDGLVELLPDLKANYEAWEKSHFLPEFGLFWQTGHDDGMEYNINSRQTRDILRGAPACRPTINAYLWADARAIARVAELAHDEATAKLYREKAQGLKANLQDRLWDTNRRFFYPMARQDEEKDGDVVKKGSLTYQTGKYAGDSHGRELIGYVPWQFSMVDPGYEAAWKPLMDPDGFLAPFGPSFTERHDPQFLVTKTCCWWSGQSWPYATTQVLKAMANLLQSYDQEVVSKADYLKLLTTYARTHRKDGRPYLAEAADPDTGSFQGYDGHNHSEHYFHSGFNDLIITGLVGLRPRDDDMLEIVPLAPDDWPYFRLEGVPYRDHSLTIAWDRDGNRYGKGPGLKAWADGSEVASSATLSRLSARLGVGPAESGPRLENFAVNNDGLYYPRVATSFTGPGGSTSKLVDGNSWYHIDPPNRWTSAGSPNAADTVEIDLGTARTIDRVKLYVLDDGEGSPIRAPERIDLELWDGSAWKAPEGQRRTPESPEGHRANVIRFPAAAVTKFRVTLNHRAGSRSGLSEIEAWGDARIQSLDPAPMPAGNLAYNPGGREFPRATASFTSQFDRVSLANDGIVSFQPSPANRWTSYQSPNATDWLEIDLGEPREVGRAELAIYDDRGGVQAPERYTIQAWDGNDWKDVARPRYAPEKPVGGQFNQATFDPVTASKVRVVFQHKGRARSGVSELYLWSR